VSVVMAVVVMAAVMVRVAVMPAAAGDQCVVGRAQIVSFILSTTDRDE
jgi:hypothetical protein